MTTLVTGAAGLLGSAIVRKLKEQGEKVVGTVHNLTTDKVFGFMCDLRKEHDCELVVKNVDYVIHCAAVISGAGIIAKTPLVHVTPNVIMNTNILEAAYKAKIKKFVFFGSTTSYPPSGDRPVAESEAFDGDPDDRYFAVGWVKRYGEKLCQLYSEKITPRMPCIVLRPSNMYGPNDNYNLETCHVTPALIRKIAEHQNPIEVWGDGSEIRDLVYVDDMADATLLALEKMEHYDPINVGLGKGYSVKEILGILMEIEGFSPEIKYNRERPTMINKRYVDVSKAQAVLGFKAKTSLEEGLKKTLAWYKREGV